MVIIVQVFSQAILERRIEGGVLKAIDWYFTLLEELSNKKSNKFSFFSCFKTTMETFSVVFKVVPSPSKKNFIRFNENPLEVMKNAFYIILEVLSVPDFLVM